LRIDLKARGTAGALYDFIDTGGTIPLRRFCKLGEVDANWYRGVGELQVCRLVSS
jgi:hypothetical protein